MLERMQTSLLVIQSLIFERSTCRNIISKKQAFDENPEKYLIAF